MLTVLGGLAEFERELIRARTSEGRARAKARGVGVEREGLCELIRHLDVITDRSALRDAHGLRVEIGDVLDLVIRRRDEDPLAAQQVRIREVHRRRARGRRDDRRERDIRGGAR